MHKIETFLNDALMHLETKVGEKPLEHMSIKDLNYILECEKLCLTTLALLTAKKAYDKHIPHDGAMMEAKPGQMNL